VLPKLTAVKFRLFILAEKYPKLTFGGWYVDRDNCSAYTFEGRGGEFTDRAVENRYDGRWELYSDDVEFLSIQKPPRLIGNGDP
jgi:hypothetical protein